jgi:hypothetical protein
VPASHGDDVIPRQVVADIKSATVFVKGTAAAKSWSGSGFVVRTVGQTGYVVTNHHVATAPEGVGPATLTLVFASGTRNERSVRAEVLAADAEADLALLRVTGVKDLPRPIDLDPTLKLIETMPVYGFGFPFGQALATGKGNPAITVSRGSVSSLRTNDRDEVQRVQIDGALNPGDSGGPVVDGQGRLVGVCVSGIRGSGIAFAIPAREVISLLGGRPGKAIFKPRKDARTTAVEVVLDLVDPFDQIRAVTLYHVRSDQMKGAGRAGGIAALAGAAKVPLTLNRGAAAGSFRLTLPDRNVVGITWQAAYVTRDGKTTYTDAREFRIDTATASIVSDVPPKVASVPGRRPSPPPMRRRETISETGETRIIGGAFDPTFQDRAPKDGVLIGLQVGLGRFVQNDIVIAVRPIYRVGGREVRGKLHGTNLTRPLTIRAKPGYAVAGITAKGGLRVDGFRITFVRVRNDGTLDPTDSYPSAWIGGTGGGPETELGGDGTPVIGVVGKSNKMDCTGLGLILKR